MAEGQSYYSKISLANKTPEEAERITKLFEENLNLANKVASKYYKTKYWDFDESLQIARTGLWKACLIWDPNKYRLSTLAYNIINRDFIDYDRQQKKQPDILFNLEDTCVTEDLSLNDVLEDTSPNAEEFYEQTMQVKELNTDIKYVLDDISEELNLSKSIVKIVYLVYIESGRNPDINMKQLNFIPKNTVKLIIAQLKERLVDIL